MLQQRQQNQVNQLQTQTTYGLGRSSSNKDFAKGVLKTRASQSKSSENNPFALRDRDLNKSNEKQLKKDQSAKKVTLRVSSTKNQGKTSKSPSVTRGNKHKVSVNQRSPATTSIQSSGNKTPCISMLTQHQSNYHHQNSSSSVGLRKSAQKTAPNFEMNYDQIAEEDNDSSSFLAAEREANQIAHDDAHSQLSQNRIGAHLLASQDTYQYYPHHEAFRTPKPSRDNEIQSSNQSPLTSQRNNIQRISGMPLNRNELLQMSQQTTLVNHGARITYEREGYATQCPKQISPIQHHSHAQLYQLQRDQANDMQSRISSSQLPTVAAAHNNQSSISPSRRLNSRYDNSDAVSGLALNVRKQTSPDRYSQNTISPSPSNNIMMGQDGRLVLVANQQAHIVENSYDHDQATRLIEDNSPTTMSPPQTNSCRKVLNPYMPTSADNSIHQVSSMNTRGCSPAQIKLEPVRIVPTTGFDQQQRIDFQHQYNGQNDDSNQSPLKQYNQRKQSSSPLKQLSTASPSPCKQSPIPARQNIINALQINTITEESPDTGNPLVAQSIYENLKRMDMETIAMRKSTEMAMEQAEVETISASDVSVALDTTEKKLDLQQRPKSSQLTARRRRDQRKTPTGRNTANAMTQLSKSKDEKQGTGKRTKYRSNNMPQLTQNAHQRSKNESSQSPRRQRSTSSVGKRSSNAGVKRNSTVNQSCPISMKEQMRLANLQRAKQYGNRCSKQNKSGLTKGTSPSKKQGGESETSESRSYSPLRPEILSACDLSVSVNIVPKEFSVHEKASVERKQKVRSSMTRNSHNSSSVQRRSKHEVKMSGPAQRAKAEFLQKHNCAKKIQKNFRGYLDKQAQIEEELAREAERHAHMVFIHTEAGKVQRAFKAYMTRIGVMRAMQQRQRLKMIVNDLVTAWKTRRSLNCLGSEVQEFVNCENDRQRIDLRNNFHVLFAKVIKNKLYLEDNYEKLQKIRQQIAAKMQQAKIKKQHGGPSNCANRANKRQMHQPVGQNDSPFKKSRPESPEKVASPIKSKQNKQSSLHLNSTNHNPPQRQTAQTRNSHIRNNSSTKRKQLSKNHRNSSASLGSVKEMDHAVTNVRNSFDNQAMHELRNFIQNSDKKNESYCSIQFTSGPAPQTNERNKASHRNFSQNNENSQVLIQVHNKSLMDVISPQNNTKSSEQRPVNIMLGSCTRFSQKKFASGASIEERPEPPTATISKWNHGPSAERKQSQDSGCEYKQSLKRVRARVDCWNRSANSGEITPNDRVHQTTPIEQQSTANRREQQIQNVKNAEKRADSGMKTPVQAQHGRHMTGTSFGSFNNSTNLAANQSRNKQQQQPLDSRSKSTTQINNQNSKNQNQNQRQQHHQTMQNVNQATPLVRRKSMLREPTKFVAQEEPKTNHKAIDIRRIGDMRQSPAIINQSRSTTPTVAGASSRLEQLARPKSSQMVSSSKNNQAAVLAANLQTTNATSKSFGKSATERSGYENHQTIAQQPLSRNRQIIKSSLTQQPMPNMQTQIFTMRETLLNLTSAMEAIASEADANQRLLLKQSNTSGYGLNSQHRAAIKSIQAQEKTFSGLMATVQEHFQAFRDQAVPSHPSQNSDLV